MRGTRERTTHRSHRRKVEEQVGDRRRRRDLDDLVLVLAQKPDELLLGVRLDEVGAQDVDRAREGPDAVARGGAHADRGVRQAEEDVDEEALVEDEAAVRLG